MTYTFVTVVHKPDYPLLRLQARSLARYLSPDATDEIYVVANQGLNEGAKWQLALLHDYGPLADKIRFFDASQIAKIPGTVHGWESQQILKLMIARVVSSDRYIVLDAKNHLVFPLSPKFYENGDRIRSIGLSYEGNGMQRHLQCSLRYFGVDEEDVAQPFLPTTTPFVFPTRVVNELIATVAQREGKDFPLAFEGLNRGPNHMTTEFLLFCAFLCSLPGGIGQFYDTSGRDCPAIWPSMAAEGQVVVEQVTARVEDEHLPFFGVHRRAFPLLDDRSKQAIVTLWVRRHLFGSVERALRFIDSWGACPCCGDNVVLRGEWDEA